MVRQGRPATTDDGSANANAVQEAPIKKAKVAVTAKKEVEATNPVKVFTDEMATALILKLEEAGIAEDEIGTMVENMRRKSAKVVEGLIQDLVWDAIEEGGSHYNEYTKLYRVWEQAEKEVAECEHTVKAQAALATVDNFRMETVQPIIIAKVNAGEIELKEQAPEVETPKTKKPASRKAKKGQGKKNG